MQLVHIDDRDMWAAIFDGWGLMKADRSQHAKSPGFFKSYPGYGFIF